jgi:hypothetical protein
MHTTMEQELRKVFTDAVTIGLKTISHCNERFIVSAYNDADKIIVDDIFDPSLTDTYYEHVQVIIKCDVHKDTFIHLNCNVYIYENVTIQGYLYAHRLHVSSKVINYETKVLELHSKNAIDYNSEIKQIVLSHEANSGKYDEEIEKLLLDNYSSLDVVCTSANQFVTYGDVDLSNLRDLVSTQKENYCQHYYMSIYCNIHLIPIKHEMYKNANKIR